MGRFNNADIRFREDRVLQGMVAGYVVFWLWMLIAPYAWFNWWLENALILAAAVYFVGTFRWFRFSNVSYAMIIVFMALHTFGAHYSYNTTPIDTLMQEWFGFKRDNFDRLVHFSFGLLMVYPVWEFGIRVMALKRVWGYFVSPALILAFGALYELIEMWVAQLVNPEAGTRFLGIQGDVWDSHHDIEMALYGAVVTILIQLLIGRATSAGFRKPFRQTAMWMTKRRR